MNGGEILSTRMAMAIVIGCGVLLVGLIIAHYVLPAGVFPYKK